MKQEMNTKELLNALLERLIGRRFVNNWWKSPNKAFGGKTPIAMWKGTTTDKLRVKLYLIQSAMQEGS